jgi:hypothetical protein
MRRVLAATATELLELQSFSGRLPVLGRRIIPLFAITALQCNDFSGHFKTPASSSKLSAVQLNLCHHNTERSGLFFTSLNALMIELQGSHAANINRITPSHSNTNFASRHILVAPQAKRARHPLYKFFPDYCTISAMVPAPTVCPPSRMAKRKPFSIATGVISSITRLTLSPGITISVPAGNSATPVTSVVRR